MPFDIYIVFLITAFSEYLPYMTKEEVERMVLRGEWPDADEMSVWKLRKLNREMQLREVFGNAYGHQKK